MSVTFDRYKKNCGNCSYWCGPRTPMPNQRCFKVEHDAKGRCAKKNHPSIMCFAVCSYFDLHPICK